MEGTSVLDKLFFKMKPKRCSTSQFWSQILLVIFGGVIASQNSKNLKINKIKLFPLFHSYITKVK